MGPPPPYYPTAGPFAVPPPPRRTGLFHGGLRTGLLNAAQQGLAFGQALSGGFGGGGCGGS
jgi:hypothetical protein